MKAGIIIPFRDTFGNGERYEELRVLLRRIKSICGLHNQEYEVCVAEQYDGRLFNRGSLINAGVDIMKDKCDYFIFHDVDNIPVSNDNVYRERKYTGNICGIINGEHFSDKDNHFGDVVFFKKEDFFAINGICNYYWGWGFEVSNVPFKLNQLGIKTRRGDSVFETMVHETSNRFNGNPNFVNNVLLYHLMERLLVDGYNELEYNLDGMIVLEENVIEYRIKLPIPQYDITRNLTVDEIVSLVGECDENRYNELVKQYSQ